MKIPHTMATTPCLIPTVTLPRMPTGFVVALFRGRSTSIENGYVQVPALPSGYRPNLWNGNIGAMNNTLRHPENFGEMSLLQGVYLRPTEPHYVGTAYHASGFRQ